MSVDLIARGMAAKSGGGSGSGDIYISTFNESSYTDVLTAVNSGKVVMCYYPQSKKTFFCMGIDENDAITFYGVYNESGKMYSGVAKLNTNNQWEYNTITIIVA